MSINRRSFLLASAAGAMLGALNMPRSAGADPKPNAKNVIVVMNTGGWDPTYALDPKPGVATIDAPAGDVRSYAGIDILTDPARPKVTDFFAKYADITAVVNGVQVQSIVHPDCWKRIMTGTASDQNPDVGAIIAHELGADLPVPYLVLGHTAFAGPFASESARAGTTNQIISLLDEQHAYPSPYPQEGRFSPAPADLDAIQEYVRARGERLYSSNAALGYNHARVADFLDSARRGKLLQGYAKGFGERSLNSALSQQAALALSAVETGLCRAVQIERPGWDTHADNEQQGDLLEELFDALATIADELSKRPGKAAGSKLLDETLVVVLSEMGRTPKLNKAKGKDHWPVTSALVIGGGVAGGKVIGETGDQLEALSVDLATGLADPSGKQLQVGNLVAGILTLAGVDASAYLPKSEPLHALVA